MIQIFRGNQISARYTSVCVSAFYYVRFRYVLFRAPCHLMEWDDEKLLVGAFLLCVFATVWLSRCGYYDNFLLYVVHKTVTLFKLGEFVTNCFMPKLVGLLFRNKNIK